MSPPPCSPELKRNFTNLIKSHAILKSEEEMAMRVRVHASSPELNDQIVNIERRFGAINKDPENMTMQGGRMRLQLASRVANPFIWQEVEDEEKSSFSEVSEMKNTRISPDHNKGRFFKKGQFKIEVFQPTKVAPNKTLQKIAQQMLPKINQKPIQVDSKNAQWALLLLTIAAVILTIELLKNSY